MRWLRCVLSREFKIEKSLLLWDFVICGIEPNHKNDKNAKGSAFLQVLDDPLINLDFLCVAMIL